MKTQINEITRMQLLAGVINESQLEEGIASTDHLEVGEEYKYRSGIFKGRGEGDYDRDGNKVSGGGYFAPVRVKVVKIVGGQTFVGEILEDNETTEYKGWKKGENYSLNTSNIADTSNKQLSALNPVVEPKNDDEKNPTSTEAFNKVIAWAKENKLRTVNQVNEYGPNDIYIRNWSGGPLDVIVHISKEKELIDLLKTLGGKIQRNHMDEETKGARIGLRFEEVKESFDQLDEIVDKVLEKLRAKK